MVAGNRVKWAAAACGVIVVAAMLALLLRPSGDRRLAPMPGGLPATLSLGMASSPGGAAAMTETAPFGYRYQYLAGGVANGWTNWEENGEFVSSYIRESRRAGIVPVFTYYMLQHSVSGDGSEQDKIERGLKDPAVVTAYLADVQRFFESAATGGGTVVMQFEPDLWGFAHQIAGSDDASDVEVAVPAATGQPSNLAGLARAILALRDWYAPEVLVAYSLSNWGTGEDFTYGGFSTAEVRVLAESEAAFYRSLDASFDLVFAEFADRDAGYKQVVDGDGGASWWDDGDFARHIAFVGTFTKATRLRAMLWQIPFGNTRMAAMDNTEGHYQDNRVEWLLGENASAHLHAYMDAGVIALLFGRGAGGATDASDAEGDGVTNTRPLDGATRLSLSADDDGGYFRAQAAAYYKAPLALP